MRAATVLRRTATSPFGARLSLLRTQQGPVWISTVTAPRGHSRAAFREQRQFTSGSSSSSGPLAHYDTLVAQGTLRKDDFQRGVTEKLQRLYDNVAAYAPPDIPEPVEYSNLLQKWRGVPSSPTVPPIPCSGQY